LGEGFSQFTVEAWVKFDNTGNNKSILIRTGSTGHFGFSANGYFQWHNAAGQWGATVYYPNTVTDTDWHHWAGTYDINGGPTIQDQVKVYVDGVPVSYQVVRNTISQAIGPSTGATNIGRTPWNTEYIDGDIEELRVWDVARTQAEIQASMNLALTGSESGLAHLFNFDEGSGLSLGDQAGSSSGSLVNMTGTEWFTSPLGGGSGNTVTLTVTDNSGNSSNCTSTITVEDNLAPVPNVASLPLLTEDCSITLSAPGATDNCAGSVTATTTDPLTYSVQGSYSITWTYDDGNGNTSTQTQTVTIDDVTPPTALCQDITVQLDVNGIAGIVAADVDNGSNDACGIASMSLDLSSFDCTDIGGGSGFTSDFALDFTNGNDYVTIGSVISSGSSYTKEAWVNAAASTCENIISSGSNPFWIQNNKLSAGHSSSFYAVVDPAAFPLNTWTHVAVTYDAATSTLSLYKNGVQVAVNTNAPNYSGGGNAIGKHLGGGCNYHGLIDEVRIWNYARSASEISANIGSTMAGSETGLLAYYPMEEGTGASLSDASGNGNTGSFVNMGTSPWTAGVSGLSTGGAGVAVTLTVYDVNGNVSTCTANVTVEDNLPPIAICQDITVQLDANGSVSISAADIDNGSSDNCNVADLSLDIAAFDCGNVGPNTVTLTVTDDYGNSSTCTSIVTVEDTITPIAICQDITIQLNAGGLATIVAADVNNGSNDNCGIASLTISQSNFECADAGPNSVVLTVTDNNGLVSTCTSIVTVVDTEDPVALCQDVTVQLDSTGQATLTAAEVNLNSTDNCGIAGMSLDLSIFNCADIASGAVGAANQYALDFDGTNERVEIGNGILTGGSYTKEAWLYAEATDCRNFLSAANKHQFWVMNKLNGGHGYSYSLVQDNVNFPTYQWVHVALTYDAATSTLTMYKNGVQIAVNTSAPGYSDGGFFSISGHGHTGCNWKGQIDEVRLWDHARSITDLQSTKNTTLTGNESGLIAYYNFEDGGGSTILTDVTGNGHDGVLKNMEANTDWIPSTAPLTAGSGSTTGPSVTLTVTDLSGNTNTCTSTVTVEDNIAPVAICQDFGIQLNSAGLAIITIADIDNGSWDNCGIDFMSLDVDTFDITSVGVQTVILTVTDLSGNTSSCTANVIIGDIVDPVALCQDITIQLDVNGTASISSSDIDNGSSDDVGIASMTLSQTNFDCSNITPSSANNYSLDFDGSNDWVKVSDKVSAASLGLPTQAITLETWVKPNSFGIWRSMVSFFQDNGSFERGWDLETRPNNRFAFALNSVGGGGGLTYMETSGSFSPNMWHHVAGVYDGTSMKIYVNGQLEQTSFAENGDIWYSDAWLALGMYKDDNEANSLPGTLDEVRIWNLAKTQSEIQASMNTTLSGMENGLVAYYNFEDGPGSTTVTDVSGNGLNGTLTNMNPASDWVTSTLTISSGNQVTMTVTDFSGNSDECTATVTVVDNLAPTVICQDVTVQLDANGSAMITVADVDNGTFDGCGIDSMYIDNSYFDCSDVASTQQFGMEFDGVNDYTISEHIPSLLTADGTIEMWIYPELKNSSMTFIGYRNVTGSATRWLFNFTANLAFMGFWNQAGYELIPNTFVPNQWQHVAIVDDGTGTHVYRNGVLMGTFNQQFNTAMSGTDLKLELGVDIPLNEYFKGKMDEVRIWTTVKSQAEIVAGMNTELSGTEAGLEVYYTFNEGPVNSTITDMTGNGNESALINMSAATDWVAGAPILPQSNVVTLTAVDNYGNTSSCTSNITVVDYVAPTANCQDVTVELGVSGIATVSVADVENGSFDACGIDSMYIDKTYFDCNSPQSDIITLTVIDMHGNSSSCTSTVTLVDIVNPSITCPADVEYWTCASDTSLTLIAPTVYDDNCGVATVLNSHTGTADASGIYPQGENQVVWTVTDNFGNTTECIQIVMIHAKAVPVIDLIGDPLICFGEDLDLSLVAPLGTCQSACDLPTGYCTSGSNIVNLMNIGSVGIDGVSNSSGQSSYSDFTSSVAGIIVIKDNSFNLTIQTESNFGNQGYLQVHFDWDRDGVFETSVTGTPGNNGPNVYNYSMTVNVPASADLGLTAMRVVLSNLAVTGACGNYGFGETEDYTLDVQGYDPSLNVSYSWMYQGTQVSSGDSYALLNPNTSINGFYDITIKNTAGCSNSEQVEILVNDPQIQLPADTISTMLFDTVLLDIGTFDTYYWNTGSTVNPFQVPDYGVYHVLVTENGCFARDTIVIAEKQDILISHGWSNISTYINTTMNIATLLDPLYPFIVIAKDDQGNTYWPFVGINTVNNMIPGEGYQVRALSNQWVSIEGTAVDPTILPITVPANSSIVGYLRRKPAPIATMLSSIQSSIKVVTKDDGKVYWPLVAVNQIGDMEPGEGYNFNMHTSATFTYPANSVTFSKGASYYEQAVRFESELITGNKMVVGILDDAWMIKPEIGDEIGAFNNKGQLTGSGVFDGTQVVLTVWGDDEIDKGKAMTGSQHVEFRLWSQATGVEHKLNITEWLEGDGTYRENSVAIAGKIGLTEEQIDNSLNVYPNPVRTTAMIEYNVVEDGEVLMLLYNSIGEVVREIMAGDREAGAYTEEIDLTNFQAGVYYVKLLTNDSELTRKVTKM
jgi:hypothetical protein